MRLLLLFFPGVICAYIVDTLTIHRPRSQFMFMVNSLVLGLASYFLYWALLRLVAEFTGEDGGLTFLRALTDVTVPISFREVAYATATAVALGLGVTITSTYKLHFRVARGLGLTKKFGELDVWGFVFNSAEVEWATIRDHRHGLIYDGWIELFSDDAENAEVLLREVRVLRNDSGELLYEVDSLYLSLSRGDISIEFRDVAEPEGSTNAQENP